MDAVILQSENSFASQVKYPNTIYIIRYGFDLNSSKIKLPHNVVLKFDGGIIYNGKIEGNHTCLDALPVHIFDNVIILGSWDVTESYAEWFGALGDGKHDDGPALRAVLSSPFNIVRLLGTKIYGVGSYAEKDDKVGLLTYHDNTTIIGSQKGTEDYRCPQIKALSTIEFDIFFKVKHRITTFCGFQIYGSYKKTNRGYEEFNIKNGIEASNGQKMLGYFEMDNVEVGYVSEDAAHLSTYCCSIHDCLIRFCNRGFVFDGKKSTVTSCIVSNCFVIASRSDAFYTYRTFYSNFIQCYADHCGYDYNKNSNNQNTFPIFHISNSQGITINGCGAEQAAKIVVCEESNNVVFTGGHFNVLDEVKINEEALFYDFFNCNSISFIGTHLFETQKHCSRISARNTDNLAFVRCLYKQNGKLTNLERNSIAKNSSFIMLNDSKDEICTSDNRPQGLTDKDIGCRLFDASLNKPIWWSKKGWVDANGNLVKDK